MLYIGHFTVDERTDDPSPRHDYITTLTEATNVQQATEKFKDLIRRMVTTQAGFQSIGAVYLEDVIEIEQIPGEALITRYQSSQGAFPKSISHSLPGYNGSLVRAYGHGPDVGSTIESQEEYPESTPFMEF